MINFLRSQSNGTFVYTYVQTTLEYNLLVFIVYYGVIQFIDLHHNKQDFVIVKVFKYLFICIFLSQILYNIKFISPLGNDLGNRCLYYLRSHHFCAEQNRFIISVSYNPCPPLAKVTE